jgi:hypothetical protein
MRSGLIGSLMLLAATTARADAPSQTSPEEVSGQIDALLSEAWRQQGVSPALPSSDAMFLRRACLDLTGAIPTVRQVRAFLADESPDKRSRLIDELLKSPSHATHLAHLWRDIMLPRARGTPLAGVFENWLQSRFHAGARYDELIFELLTASGQAGANGPTLFYSSLEVKPEELASSTSRIMLGVQIGCAQCHDHPFSTRWKQKDFWGLAAFFAQVSGQRGTASVMDVNSGEVKLPKTDQVVPPQFPGEKEPAESGAVRRRQLAQWVTAPDNPYFARATVNRVWSMLFGAGLVDPVDDFGDHNPPSHPQILEVLSADFVANGYDLRRLFRVIMLTASYQLSSELTGELSSAPQLFAVMPVKSLSAEQIYESILRATGRRAPLVAASRRNPAERQSFVAKFDAPTQRLIEFQAGIPQVLTMLNGPLISAAADLQKSDLLAALVDAPFLDSEQRIETLYLATLSRLPDEAERARLIEFTSGRDPEKALSDILWVLLNSSEFLLNR